MSGSTGSSGSSGSKSDVPLYERNRRRHYRTAPDPELALEVALEVDDAWHEVRVMDTTASGMGLASAELDLVSLDVGGRIQLRLSAPCLKRPLTVPVIIRHLSDPEWSIAGVPDVEPLADGSKHIGVEVDDLETFYAAVVPDLLPAFNRRMVRRHDLRGEGVALAATVGDVDGEVQVFDLSTHGLSILVGPPFAKPAVDDEIVLSGALPDDEFELRLATRVRHVTAADDSHRVGVEIDRAASEDWAGCESSIAMFVIRAQMK